MMSKDSPRNEAPELEEGFQRLYVHTPLLESTPMSARAGFKVHLKMENMQPPGSFKLRGISNLIQKEMQKGCKRIVSPSGGNAGLSAAYTARKLGLPCTVVVPTTTGQTMVDHIKQQGSSVVQKGGVWNESNEIALTMAQHPECAYIPPFDHPDLWEGHSSMVTEICDDLEGSKPDLFVLAVGGGGLLCGVCRGLERVGWQDVPILAMETDGANCFHEAIEAGHVVSIPAITSIANCLGSLVVAEKAMEHHNSMTIYSEVVTDKEALSACLQFLDDQRVLVEPACGAALAAIYSGTIVRLQKEGKLGDVRTVVAIVCGGYAVTLAQIEQWRKQLKL